MARFSMALAAICAYVTLCVFHASIVVRAQVTPVATLPTLPDNFAATVMHNYEEKGYSASYNEFWDGTYHNYRVDGRFSSTYETYITYGTAIVDQFRRPITDLRPFAVTFNLITNDPVNWCRKWPKHEGEDRSMLYSSSKVVFDFLADSSLFDWIQIADANTVPQNTDARGIPCKVFTTQYAGIIPPYVTLSSNDEWQSDLHGQIPPWSLFKQVLDPSNSDIATFNLTFVYYVAIAQTSTLYPDTSVPIRLVSNGTYALRSNLTEQIAFSHYLDWTLWFDFQTYPYDPFGGPYFHPPISYYPYWNGKCDSRNTSEAAPFPLIYPSESTVVPHNASSGLPRLPKQFYMVLEAKMADQFTVNGVPQINSLVWNLDWVSGNERFDYMDDLQQWYAITYNYDATQFGGGTVYSSIPTSNNGHTCQAEAVAAASETPLEQIRAGSIPLVFKDPTFTASAVYIGRGAARGVVTDVYRVVKTGVLHADSIYNFNMDLHFVPDGWAFLNHPTSEGKASLLRVINNGTQTRIVSGRTTPYTDIWDVFQYAEGDPQPEIYNPVYIGCSKVQTPNNTVYPFAFSSLQNTHYSTIVEYVNVDKGITLNYAEYVDGDTGRFRTDGKLSETFQAELIDLTTLNLVYLNTQSSDDHDSDSKNLPNSLGYDGSFFQTPPTSTSPSCNRTTINRVPNVTVKDGWIWLDPTNLQNDPLYMASYSYLNLIDANYFIYGGQEVYRQEVTDKFTTGNVPIQLPVKDSAGTITGYVLWKQFVYVSPLQAGQTKRVPKGTVIEASYKNMTDNSVTPFVHININYMNFLHGKPTGLMSGFYDIHAPQGGLFDVLDTVRICTPDADVNSANPHMYNDRRQAVYQTPTRSPRTSPDTDVLQFPKDGFSLSFESRLNTNSSGEQVYSVRWYVDFVNRRERIDIAPQVTLAVESASSGGDGTVDIKSFSPYSYIYFYGDEPASQSSTTGALPAHLPSFARFSSLTSRNVTAFWSITRVQSPFSITCDTYSSDVNNTLPLSVVNPLLTKSTGEFFELFASFGAGPSNNPHPYFAAHGYTTHATSSISVGSSDSFGTAAGMRGYTSNLWESTTSNNVPSSKNDGSYYTVTKQDFLVAPFYWNFPGRQNASINSMPIKYTQYGTYQDVNAEVPPGANISSVPYSIQYDILSFIPTAPPLDLFNVIDFPACENIPDWIRIFNSPTSPSSVSSTGASGSSSGGATAASSTGPAGTTSGTSSTGPASTAGSSSSSTGDNGASGAAAGGGGTNSGGTDGFSGDIPSDSGPSFTLVLVAALVSVTACFCVVIVIGLLLWRRREKRRAREHIRFDAVEALGGEPDFEENGAVAMSVMDPPSTGGYGGMHASAPFPGASSHIDAEPSSNNASRNVGGFGFVHELDHEEHSGFGAVESSNRGPGFSMVGVPSSHFRYANPGAPSEDASREVSQFRTARGYEGEEEHTGTVAATGTMGFFPSLATPRTIADLPPPASARGTNSTTTSPTKPTIAANQAVATSSSTAVTARVNHSAVFGDDLDAIETADDDVNLHFDENDTNDM